MHTLAHVRSLSHIRRFRPQLVISLVSVVLCFAASLVFGSTVDWWHGLSQANRNQAILSMAYSQNGQHTDMECKEWAQHVVYNASQGDVWPPQNQSCSHWYANSYCYPEPQPFPVSWCQPGQIIQMCWHNTNGSTLPHTAIVTSRTSTGMYWIDCNWQGDGTVRTHFVSFTQFSGAVGQNYTVYEIH